MLHSKEKAPKKGIGSSVTMALLVIAAGAAILSLGALTTPVFAAPPSGETPGHSEGHGTPRQDPGQQDDPNCWGDVTRQLAQTDDGSPGLGHHASSFGEPRDGVGNQAEDTPAQHGDVVGDMNRPPINCQ